MKIKILYIFLSALAALFCLCSCGLEEPVASPEDKDGYVEFVARRTSYNKQEVATKGDGNLATFDDDEIHNAFLIIFDAQGRKLLCDEIDENLSAKVDKGLGSVTACILANVPTDFAHGIIGTTNPSKGTNDNKYLDTAVLDFTYAPYQSVGILGVPAIDLDSDGGQATAAVPCIPMFGIVDEQINLTSSSAVIEISLRRLFAKISVIQKMNMELDVINRYSAFKIKNYTLTNLPKKVRLLESTNDNSWTTSDNNYYGAVSTTNLNVNIYNGSINDPTGITGFRNEYTFYFYAPEYYVSPKSTITDNPRYKPNNVDKTKRPLYLSVLGEFNPIRGNDVRLQYDIYLGEDNTDNFNIKRNRHYTNTLTVCGTTNHSEQTDETYIDHRVHATTEMNMLYVNQEAANCYIIKEAGSYSIPAILGVYKVTNGDINSESIPWCTGKRVAFIISDNNNIKYSTPTYDESAHAIKFDVTSVANGNAILAIYHEDNPATNVNEGETIEWSWHLWFNTGAGSEDIQLDPIDDQIFPNGAIVMDRNLGASYSTNGITEGVGLYYQYGNKNPYVTNSYVGGGTSSQTWQTDDNIKAINDPCPPGYRVPSASIWGSSTTMSHSSLDQTGSVLGGVFLMYEQSGTANDIYLPYAFLNKSNKVENVSKDRYASGYSYGSDTIPIDTKYDTNFLGNGTVEYSYARYSEVTYILYGNAYIGASLTNSGIWPYASYIMPLDRITDLSIKSYKYTITKKKYNCYLGTPNLTKLVSSSSTDTTVDDATGEDLILLKTDLITSLGFSRDLNISVAGAEVPASLVSYSSTQGYQVRCVSERSQIQ